VFDVQDYHICTPRDVVDACGTRHHDARLAGPTDADRIHCRHGDGAVPAGSEQTG
jgi:hypothetical protein